MGRARDSLSNAHCGSRDGHLDMPKGGSFKRDKQGAVRSAAAKPGEQLDPVGSDDLPGSPRSPRLASRDALSLAVKALWDPAITEGDVYKPCELLYKPPHPT